MRTGNRYLLITPVKNEERYVRRTLDSVIAQTLKPVQWIIVDDNSDDGTPAILAEYARRVDWIKIVKVERTGGRRLGSAEIAAFNFGLTLVQNAEFDFVVKLDSDLDLPQDYFEQLVSRFQSDSRLGIASGVYLEERQGQWLPVKMPAYHAAGASKMIRRSCFEDIHGFISSRGWDTIDEIRALMSGWRTAHFEELRFLHLKPEGSGAGNLSTNKLHGEIYYVTGGGTLFFLLKLLDRLIHGRPFPLAPLAMLYGFLKPWVQRKPRSVTPAEAKFYSRLLNARIRRQLFAFTGRVSVRPSAPRAL
jgi:glycosyltransferase involved in cell wall biosynthesis